MRALGAVAVVAFSRSSHPPPPILLQTFPQRRQFGRRRMFRKVRRVNVRKRNESEDDDEERDEALSSHPPPPPGGDGPAVETELPAPKPPLLPLPTGCVPLVSPSAVAASSSGGTFAFSSAEVVGRGGPSLPAPELQPPPAPIALVLPPPPPSQQLPLGNNGHVSAVSKPKERKKGKESIAAPGVPRGSRSLLSFQDEEEGKHA